MNLLFTENFNLIMTYLGYVVLGIILILGTIHFLRILFFSRSFESSTKANTSLSSNEVEVKDRKVIAAITSAIQCYYDAEIKASTTSKSTTQVPPSGFIVRSIKKRI